MSAAFAFCLVRFTQIVYIYIVKILKWLLMTLIVTVCSSTQFNILQGY
jgi:hypothetical protein